MASLDDYLLRGQIPLGEEGERFRNLLRTVNTYNVNRAGGQALSLAGADIDPSSLAAKTRPGVLDTAFKALSAPRNLAFRIAGVDPEVTGGDIFRTRKDDSVLERIGKFGGAFAFDVATDPLSYVGAPGTLGRKAVSSLAATRATRSAALSAGETALRAAGKDADGVIETLYKNSPLVKQRDELLRVAGDIGEESDAINQYALRRKNILDTGLDTGLVDETNVDSFVRRDIAEEELGRVMGESLLSRGRSELLDNLTRIFGDEDVARQVFSSLPSEVRGGLDIRTVLGKTVGKVPGTGRGRAFGGVSQATNEARFKATELLGRTVAAATGKSGLGGQFGPAWTQVKTGLRRSMQDPNFDILKDNLGRTTITAYDAMRTAHRNMSRARLTRMFAVWNVIGENNAVERDFVDRGLGDDFIDGRLLGFEDSEAVIPDTASKAFTEGAEQGRKLKEAINAARADQVAAGISINDLGAGYTPMYLTPEGAAKAQRKYKMVTGTTGKLGYTPSAHRKEWIVPMSDPRRGFRIDGTDTKALANSEINKLVGYDEVLVDPVQVATKYLESSARSVAAKNFVSEAMRTGVLVADLDYQATQAQFDRLSQFLAGVRKAAPQVAKRIDDTRSAAAKKLADEAGEATRDKTIAEATALRIKMNAEYDAAVEGQAAVRARLREATRAARQSRPSRGEINARLSGYSRSAAELDMQRAEVVYDDALEKLRTTRATTRLEENTSRSGFVQDEYIAMEDKYDDLILSGEAKKAAEKELSEVRAVRNRVRNAVSSSELAELDTYEAALVRREQVRSQYEEARALRGKAAERWSKFKDTPAVARTEEIQRLSTLYSRAHNALLRAQESGLEKEAIAEIRKEADTAAKALRGAIGYKLPKGSPLATYRNTLEKLAKNLGEAEFDAAKVFASEAKLTGLLAEMQDAYTLGDMESITRLSDSIKETWFSIRGKDITFDDLTDLNKVEQALLRKKNIGDLDLTKKVSRMSEYGEWLTDNDMAVLGSRGIDASAATNLPPVLQGLHGSSGVRVVLENMYRAETTAAFRDFVYKVTDPLLLMWKTGVTVGRGPAYVITNIIGGVYMSFLGGVSARNLAEGGQILVGLKNAYNQAAQELPGQSDPQLLLRASEILKTKLAGKKIGEQDAFTVLEDFLLYNGYGSTQTADAIALTGRLAAATPEEADRLKSRAVKFGQTIQFRGEEAISPAGKGLNKFVDVMLTNGYQRRMNNFAQSSELFLRFGTYLDGIKRYNDPTFALDRANLLHFDYADLSDAEQTIRRLVPFYTWTRHNVPTQLRAMFLDPGKMKKWMYAQENIGKAMSEDEDSWYEQMLPEYLQEVGGFVSRLGTPAGPIAFGSRMPYDDVNRLFKVGGLNPLNFVNYREAAKMVGPGFTLPYSLVGGVNIDTGGQFGPEGVEATGYLGLLGSIPGVGQALGARRGAEGELRVGEGAAYAISEALPQLSIIDRLLSIPEATRPLATRSQQDRALSNLLNLSGAAALTGQSATTLTPGALTAEARKRIKKQNAIVDNAAGQLGISVEWLRAQIRAGYSDIEIAAMIRTGQGQREAYEAEQERRQKAPERRFVTMLDAMSRGEVDLGY